MIISHDLSLGGLCSDQIRRDRRINPSVCRWIYLITAFFIAVFGFFPGTTATILKIVGVCVGGLTALCIGTFACHKCIKPAEDEEEETGITVANECAQPSHDRETVM